MPSIVCGALSYIPSFLVKLFLGMIAQRKRLFTKSFKITRTKTKRERKKGRRRDIERNVCPL